ncbi:MAG TPA: L,D-transpeptidase family protein, partial [Acidimicrobiia bacterium]|nr:L,D-transpeptidase family protein [Acidimicrobiia bacterium]
MSRGRVAVRHTVAVVVALGALVLGGLLPIGRDRDRPARAAGAPARANSVTNWGSAPNLGPDGSAPFPHPPVAMARAGGDHHGGYWLASGDGGVRSYGDAPFLGSLGDTKPARPIVGMAALPNGAGYWLVADDGGVFAFGSAPFLGSLGGRRLVSPIAAMAATPSGGGYWLVARDGGVFAFGDAAYLGAPAGEALHGAVIGIASSPSGRGYWLAAEDGGIFAYGDAPFLGAADLGALPAPISGIATPPAGGGYWLVGRDGQVYAFGLPDEGSPDDAGPVEGEAVGIAAFAADGYWIAHGAPFVTTPGESGPEVRTLQQKLTSLGYWVGPSVSGTFDANTTQALYAFQMLNGLPPTGKADPPTRQKLETATRPKPASTMGDLVEVDKAHQVILVVRGGQTAFVFHTSTGTEGPYTYAGKKHTAHTPEGRFAFFRQVDGWETSHLGRMYRPKYFHPNGFAIHGDTFVPSYPASHGCVRVSLPAMDFIWGQNLIPLGSPVWV